MSDFLLELLSEEIPARMQERAAADLARLFADALGKAGLAIGAVETFVTPRRLALIVRDLPDETAPVIEETKGPRAAAPPQALEGFLRKTGLTRDQLVEREGVLFAIAERPGRRIADVIADAVPAVIRGFPWPKSMRWGEASLRPESLRWVRPLQGIVAILGDELVPIEMDGLASGFATVGHRFHHPGPITIGGAHDYAAKLRACHVIVDPAERQRIVREGATAAALAAGLALMSDEGLAAENAGLTEWPVPLIGRFDPAFLAVPREVIQLTMRTNQKYFACVDGEGALAPAFVCTANIEAVDDGAAIIAGNAKVLAARLSDARFFWEQDLKVPLAVQAEKLKGIVFHEKLGTVADKVERVAKIARWLVEEGIVKSAPSLLGEGDHPQDCGGARSEAEGGERPSTASGGPPPQGELGEDRSRLADLAEQAARLCKADLVTGMVGEFPELQGVIGGYYARAQGLPPQVADAVRDHYKPVGQGDEVPTAPVTVAVSLADRLDTLVGFFANGVYPSGSKDPFALRRAALALIRIIEANALRLELDEDITDLIGHFFEPLPDPSIPQPDFTADWDELCRDPNIRMEPRHGRTEVFRADAWLFTLAGEHDSPAEVAQRIDSVWDGHERLISFLSERLRVMLTAEGYRHDQVLAAQQGYWTALGPEGKAVVDLNVIRLLARVRALQTFVATEDGANLLAGYKRAANIVRIEEKKDGVQFERAHSLAYEAEPEEQALLAALDRVEPAASAAVEGEDFTAAMSALAALRAPLDDFFDKVTVNDSDPVKRRARLGLLVRIRDACRRVANFSKIEG